MSSGQHRPVLIKEVIDFLDLGPGLIVVDGTVGSGGHAKAILEKIVPGGRLVGIDRDPEALRRAQDTVSSFGEAVVLLQGSFGRLRDAITHAKLTSVDRVLLDLGTSREQLEEGRRGFSFMREGPLDMRMDPTQNLTASELVNRLSEYELREIFSAYGEEPFSGRIARVIVEARKHKSIKTTAELAELVSRVVSSARFRHGKKRTGRYSGKRVHPATRVFQALRIVVNKEMENLANGLEEAFQILSPGGRLCVLSYHSLEDRKVKEFMKTRLIPLTKKPIIPTKEEVLENPSARSVKLRVALKAS